MSSLEAIDHVLVIDDDDRLRALLQKFLRDQGFVVSMARSAAEARSLMESIAFDALVLDIMMPGETGLSLVENLRKSSQIPVLLLSAMGEAEDRITGLEMGADDYLTKPFEPRELVARLKSILRRSEVKAEPVSVDDSSMVRFGRFRLDTQRAELFDGQTPIRLAPGELQLLVSLAKTPNEAVARHGLSDGSEAGTRSVDVQVARIRRKIEENPKFPRYLLTARGIGYTLACE